MSRYVHTAIHHPVHCLLVPLSVVYVLHRISNKGFFSSQTGQMQLVDVGMTSMVISEAEQLASLADIIHNHDAAGVLRARAASLRSALAAYAWDPDSEAFVNRQPWQQGSGGGLSSIAPGPGSFNRRVSPTSFYPLMAKAATDAQAEATVRRWLLNSSHFAITTAGDFGNNTDDNYWGLPSIEATDPAFPQLGYWRGFVRPNGGEAGEGRKMRVERFISYVPV